MRFDVSTVLRLKLKALENLAVRRNKPTLQTTRHGLYSMCPGRFPRGWA